MQKRKNQAVKSGDRKTKDHGNREVKSTVFTTFFSDGRNAAALYDAITGSVGTRPEDIEFTTLEGVLFLARKNDLGMLVNNRVLILSEHESCINPNMPLRHLLYLARTLEKLLGKRDVFKRQLIKIPTPEFYVFYNGAKDFPKEMELKLSDAFKEKREHPMLELTTKVININKDKGHRILEQCQPMNEYSTFMGYIRMFKTSETTMQESITLAIMECRKEDIMTEFLDQHSSEVENLIFTQWNFEDAMDVAKEEAREEGKAEGRAEAILELLSDLGTLPENLRQHILTEKADRTLRKWLKLAAKAESMEWFMEQIKNE